MSSPSYPVISPEITREKALNMILASIAMEELALSHILNAEGEKIQYILELLEAEKSSKGKIEGILAVNDSVSNILDGVLQNQMILKNKMEQVLDTTKKTASLPGPSGPTGATGPPGPTGPPGSTSFCCSAIFSSPIGECPWQAHKHLPWVQKYKKGICIWQCADDKQKLFLSPARRFLVSFNLNLNAPSQKEGSISLGLNTINTGTPSNIFNYNNPTNFPPGKWQTINVSNILIDTSKYIRPIALVLTLLSPQTVKVGQASLTIMEI